MLKQKEEELKIVVDNEIVDKERLKLLPKRKKPGFIVVENEGFGYYQESIPGLQQVLNEYFLEDVVHLVPKKRIDYIRPFVFKNLKLFVKVTNVKKGKANLLFFDGRSIKENLYEIRENNQSYYDFELPDPVLVANLTK